MIIMNCLLSIIVPVYQVEAFLQECLDSIFQTNPSTDSYEVIAVNDGSTDGSAAILDRYDSAHKNMTVITQANQGLSAARMNGLKKAAGEYVWFVDSDDYLAEGAIEYLLKQLKQDRETDVYITAARWFNQDGVFRTDMENLPTGMVSPHSFLKKYSANGAWHFIVNKSLFSSPWLLFPAGLIHEDTYFGKVLFYIATRAFFLDEALYYYRIRPASIMTTPSVRSAYDLVENYRMLGVFTRTKVLQQDLRWFRRCITEGILLESYNRTLLQVPTKDFKKFHRNNVVYIIHEYLGCGANRPFLTAVTDFVYLLFPLLFCRIAGERRYIALKSDE